MYSVYVVRIDSGNKNRRYIDTFESMEEAKHVCNCYVCGQADYAYIKDKDGTIFFLRKPDYEITDDPSSPARKSSRCRLAGSNSASGNLTGA